MRLAVRYEDCGDIELQVILHLRYPELTLIAGEKGTYQRVLERSHTVGSILTKPHEGSHLPECHVRFV